MIHYFIWAVTFLTLWLTIIWLNFIVGESASRSRGYFPKITFAIPVWNEERTVVRTLSSLLDAKYPLDKMEILVVNDGSTDGTSRVVSSFINGKKNVVLVNKVNGGKASAVNEAIVRATGELFAVLDADSRIEPDAISNMVSHFKDKKMGAVISRIRVDEPKNLLQRMQRFEYVMSSMTRFIMNNFGTLTITHGALSMFRTSTLRKVGGFVRDKENITEDFEIALRLRKNHYKVIMEPSAVAYTHVPSTFKGVWKQRLRWSRGYIYNMWQYRGLIFNKKHGLLGSFQLPVNVVAVFLLILNVSLISYDSIDRSFEFVFRSLTINDYFWNSLTSFPTLKEFVLARNVQVSLPLFISFSLGMYLVYTAHRVFKESIKSNVFPLVAYTFVMPYFSALNWIASLTKEIRKSKRSWR